jgi:hypothetical protein
VRSSARLILFALLCLSCGYSLSRIGSKAETLPATSIQATNRPNFEIRLIGLPNGLYDNIRFSTSRGEAWIQIGTKWEKIPETGPVPAGDYDIQLALLPNSNHAAIRIERTTGKSWYRANGRWNEIPEPK